MAKYGVKEVLDVVLYESNKPVLLLDSLKVSDLEVAAESSKATGGRGNSSLLTWDHSKAIHMKLQDALFSMKSLGILSGNAITDANIDIYKRNVYAVGGSGTVRIQSQDMMNVKAIYTTSDGSDFVIEQTRVTYDPNIGQNATNTFTMQDIPNPSDGETITIGSEIYEWDNNNVVGSGHIKVLISGGRPAMISAINANSTLVTATSISTGFTVTAKVAGSSGDSISTYDGMRYGSWATPTLTGGAPAPNVYNYSFDEMTGVSTYTFGVSSMLPSNKVVFFGTKTVMATSVKISSSTFPGIYKIVGDTVIRNETTGLDENFQVVIQKAKILSNYTLQMQAGNDAGVFDIDLEILRPSDGSPLVELIRY